MNYSKTQPDSPELVLFEPPQDLLVGRQRYRNGSFPVRLLLTSQAEHSVCISSMIWSPVTEPPMLSASIRKAAKSICSQSDRYTIPRARQSRSLAGTQTPGSEAGWRVPEGAASHALRRSFPFPNCSVPRILFSLVKYLTSTIFVCC